MATSVGGVNPVALDLPVVCQVSVPPTTLLSRLQSFPHLGQKLLYPLGSAHDLASSYVGFQLATSGTTLVFPVCEANILIKI